MLKVLLLGEYSSLHRYLKEGLQEIGNVDVRLYANGDGWKKIGGVDDILYSTSENKWKKYYSLYIEAMIKSCKIKGYDVVQYINPGIYSPLVAPSIVRWISSKNKCVSLVAAGDDYALKCAYEKRMFEYYAYDYEKSTVYDMQSLRGRMNIYADKKTVECSDIIIPSTYEYTLGYLMNKKLYNTIPFPINTNKIEYTENKCLHKIVFFHGLNRELAKGTPFIREALYRLKEKYPNDVEIIIDGHMPFDKYINVMKKANVIVDQCCAYGCGINGCIAMAQGKVVMSNNRKEMLEDYGWTDSPVFHIRPDVEQIYSQLEYIVENRKEIPRWGYESRKHVEKYNDHIKVAQQYVDAWKSTGKI